jgi:hypothetical protein
MLNGSETDRIKVTCSQAASKDNDRKLETSHLCIGNVLAGLASVVGTIRIPVF